jgi:hypothetical protein
VHTCVGIDEARRKQMELVDAVANLDRVAGVGATLAAGDNVGVLCKHINDLALEEEAALVQSG